MHVIEYIRENGLKGLEELGIKVKEYPEQNIIVLNYSQIDSPKTHPVVVECRGLILDKETLEVYCRPFDRFFNWGEAPETIEGEFKIERAVAFEKMDGSLIKIWYLPGVGWQCGTRGTAFAETDCQGFGLTFKDLVYRALGVSNYHEFNQACHQHLETGYTYLYEITSFENRVVKHYEGTKMWFLGCRANKLGNDMYHTDLEEGAIKLCLGNVPKEYTFNSMDDCLKTAAELSDLDEGYVLMDTYTSKRVKVKSPAYVAVHHLRGEGLNPKRIKELVLTNEQDEYLKYFPEDSSHITPVADQLKHLEARIKDIYDLFKGVQDQKEFALAIVDHCFSHVLFKARAQNRDPLEVWNSLDSNSRYKTLTSFIGE